MDTIFAVSSGAPPAAIAIIRLSGAAAFSAGVALSGRLPSPRTASLRAIVDPADGALLDRALVLVFPAPHSATGEDLVELHCHGGRAVVAAIEGALARFGLRQAKPGEFTRRALISGRIDLTEAEGLGDLLTAETEGQRRAAIAAAEGAVRRNIASWSERLIALAAQVEAELDFSDEDDVAAASSHRSTLTRDIGDLAGEMNAVLANPPIERLRDGIRVTIAGPPNSGKSTLLNAMADRVAAIVSPVAGTTRDRIEVPIVRDGIAYVLTDTAGLRTGTDDAIEAMGIKLSHESVATADVLLWLGDAGPPRADAIWLRPRIDMLTDDQDDSARMAVSAVTGQGMAALWAKLADDAANLLPKLDRLTLNQRQYRLVKECMASLGEAAALQDPLLIAENLRLGMRSLDEITGVTDVEAMLDSVFSRFCIGK